MEEEEEIFLETDWIHEFEKIVDEGIYYPCEPMYSLPVYSLFIEQNRITHILKKRIPFDGIESEGGCRNIFKYLQKISEEPYWIEWMKHHTEFIGSEEALEIEQKRLEKRAKQYSLSDILLFNMDSLLSDFDFDSGEGGAAADYLDKMKDSFFQSYSVEEWKCLEYLEWKDSVFLFHSINSVYFLFQEIPVIPIQISDLKDTRGNLIIEMPISSSSVHGILSKGENKSKNKNTRKVRFWEEEPDLNSSESSSEEEEESEEKGSEWGKGKWIQKRKKNRRKTEKRKHVLSSALIRSLFEN